MKKVNLYIDGTYLIQLIERKSISINIDWNLLKQNLLQIISKKLELNKEELLFEKASLFLTKGQKIKFPHDFISSIETANIDIFLNNDFDEFNINSTSLVWQASKNYKKDPYEVCILFSGDDYEFFIDKLKEYGIYRVIVSDLLQSPDYKLTPDFFINIKDINNNITIPSKTLPICPYCNEKINKEDYIHHLLIHNETQEKLYSKSLKNKVDCCFCGLAFNASESNVFLEHLAEKHQIEFDLTISETKGLKKCRRCNSVLSGCHPMVIIQHLMQNCYK